ncbi:unnamed protein product [Lactuca saligna]|uniref:RRM domain-containing protein n=1 Tax=Lactuca saligna TaxID=75948 RepID=A0AA36ED22_LACSI|nr:unnamed protein product [Lactuca saligna]
MRSVDEIGNRQVYSPATITTMFISNFPDGTRKEIIKRIFSKYGDISDVYMATKKGLNRRNFAFVRFRGVEDVARLEAFLQGLKCTGSMLEVNMAKFERNEAIKIIRVIRDIC